jgi:hypothetical protein
MIFIEANLAPLDEPSSRDGMMRREDGVSLSHAWIVFRLRRPAEQVTGIR